MAKRAAFESLDRISNLPSEVIDEILMRLPIRDAIKTSLLSRGWRYRWTSIPHLVFNHKSILPLTGQSNTTNLANFVNKTLFLHNGRISKFELNHFLQTSCSHIDHWILVLSRNDSLQHLVLRFARRDNYLLPSSLFFCQSLGELVLEGCIIKLTLEFQRLSCLTVLKLHRLTLTNETFETLVQHIPFLKNLQIRSCKPLTRLNIYAPNLEAFGINGCCESINFQTAQKVIKVGIRISPPGLPERCKLDEVIRALESLQSLIIFHPFVEILPMDNVLERLGIDYIHLKHVELYVNFDDSREILATLCLCRSSPHLKKLKITAIWSRESLLPWYEENFLKAQPRQQDNVFYHLVYVRLDGFKGVDRDMRLAQFIIQSAVVLKKFSISWEENAAVDEKLQVVEKMMQCRRASPKAEVFFNRKA